MITLFHMQYRKGCGYIFKLEVNRLKASQLQNDYNLHVDLFVYSLLIDRLDKFLLLFVTQDYVGLIFGKV